MAEVDTAFAFSVLADKSADIAGTEPMSIGICFNDKEETNACVREHFI